MPPFVASPVSPFAVDSPLVACGLAATQAAAIAASAWAGRGDSDAADAAATDAMRAVLDTAPVHGIVVTGEGAKDGAPMLADGELTGAGGADGPGFEIAVDPLECTSLCADGLPGALSTVALAPPGAFWSPGPTYYMDKLVLPRAARAAAELSESPETIVRKVAAALDKELGKTRAVILDKPRHRELIASLRTLGVVVITPPAGDVSGALAVLLPGGDADLLLGIGGTPEGVMTACAARALGGGMQGRIAPQRPDEAKRVRAAGLSCDRVLELEELVTADGAFVATGVTGGLLAAPCHRRGLVTTESLVVAGGVIRRIRQQTTPTQE